MEPTSVLTLTDSGRPAFLRGPGLQMILRHEPGGPALGRERVTAADLFDARSETWWASQALRGFPDVAAEDVPVTLDPIPVVEAGVETGALAGFTLRAIDPGGYETRLPFDRSCLDHVATRAASRLRADGRLASEDPCTYELRVVPAELSTSVPIVHGGVRALGPRRSTPIRYRYLSLPALRDRAEPVVAGDEELIPFVFYAREAFDRAEQIARRGAALDPPVETGGILLGSLVRCFRTGRVFTVITDVLEAMDATATGYSLEYTRATWDCIQSVLQDMARHPDPVRGSIRALGQFHNHRFLPAEERCVNCDERATCEHTSAFLSAADRRWCRAVFGGQPWQISQVFGLTARGEETSALFGQKGGRLVRRGYHVIDGADVDDGTMPERS